MSIFFIFVFGIFLGSFLNVLIDRLPRGERITGRSYCENCKKTLTWKDLIPVLSFLYLRGKCRYCGSKLSSYYPFVELVTGVMFALTYLLIFNFQFSIFNEIINHKSLIINLFYYLFVVSSMIVIFFADLKYGIIPDKVLFPAIIFTSSFLLFDAMYHKLVYDTVLGYPLINHILSAFGGFGFMLFLFIITKGKGMGFGDVKLVFLIGLILGFPGIFYAVYLAFLTGGAFAIILVLWKKKKLKSEVPFGPFLVVNFFIAFFFQTQLDQIFSRVIR